MSAVSPDEMERRHAELDAMTPTEREYVLSLLACTADEWDYRFAVGKAKLHGDRGPVYEVQS